MLNPQHERCFSPTSVGFPTRVFHIFWNRFIFTVFDPLHKRSAFIPTSVGFPTRIFHIFRYRFVLTVLDPVHNRRFLYIITVVFDSISFPTRVFHIFWNRSMFLIFDPRIYFICRHNSWLEKNNIFN